MKPTYMLFPLLLLIGVGFVAPVSAEVDWRIYNTLNLDNEPVDVAISNDGQWIYVLTDKGKILIYSAKGELEGTIDAGSDVDKLKAGPREDILLLSSLKRKTVQILIVDFIKNIDVSGSPFRGPADAPVTVAVFSEFQ